MSDTTTYKIIQLKGEGLILLPEKAIFWQRENTLLIADLHIGKITHFRNAGIGLPRGGINENASKLKELLDTFIPEKVIFLGDLFHSVENNEWSIIEDFVKKYDTTEFHLVQGNHDILGNQKYIGAGLHLHVNNLEIAPFLFSHEPMENPETNRSYNVCGHIHPGVLLNGKGRQRLRLPCFRFGNNQAILPAFGTFTGLALIKPEKDDRIFVITSEKVVEVS